MDYTQNLHSVIQFAQQEAQRLGSAQVEPQHLLLAIIRLGQGEAYRLLMQSGMDVDSVKQAIDNRFMQNVAISTQVNLSRTVARLLRLTEVEAGLYDSDRCGTVHLLLAILRERVNFPAMHLDEQYAITYEKIEQQYPKPHPATADSAADYDLNDEWNGDELLASMFGNQRPRQQARHHSSSDTPLLDKYGRDLSQLAREGKLDPIIGRESEIERAMQILQRRKKNNPILIGEPGVGKTAIVEGLARRMTNRRFISLDMASMVAGTTYRGQFEKRMKDIIGELHTHPDVILFIDEIHTLVGAGNAQGTLDAANILKPALARGELQCIGATTTAEYRRTIEKDGALERRFQKLMIQATSKEDTLEILRQLSPTYAHFHGVRYPENVLVACVELANRYIPNRAFPDKAIDVLDEAGARFHNQDGHPTTLREQHIERTVSMMTGIPTERVAHKENERLKRLDSVLRQYVIGQNSAIEKVVQSIRRSRFGLRDEHRPIGSFFFLGPTGVGKTYLAECLAEEMFGTRDALIRFDMSEYMEKHAVSLLVGAPPGYIAHEDGGKLTEAVRRRPYSVLLFDEIEKAHQDVYNLLLQLLDEGRMTDRQGYTVDFCNTIIIMTSNVGTRELRDFGTGIGFDAGELSYEIADRTMKKALEKQFPPEFVNRIDNIVTFAPLSRDSLRTILNLEIAKLSTRLQKRGHILQLSTSIREQLLDMAYDPKNGARPIRRVIQDQLEDKVVEQMMNSKKNKTIKIQTL